MSARPYRSLPLSPVSSITLSSCLSLLIVASALGCVDPDTIDGGTLSDGGDGDGDGPDGGVAAPDAGPGPDLTMEAFARDRVLQVEVTLAPADWDALRTEARTVLNILEPGCIDQPFPNIFNWYDASVEVEGEVIANIAVRKKGFLGSLSDTRPSLKIDFDRNVQDQGWSGLSRLTLNNSQQDPSYIRQCLAYSFFTAAGLPAPRCNYAQVTVNGEDLGVYVHVEAIKKPFIRRHFQDDEGLLFEATLSDFRAGWLNTYEQKTNKMMPDISALEEIAAALELPDDQLLAALGNRLHLEQFMTFWAAEVLTSHWDGYAGNTNNHYLYLDPDDDKLHFLPWGTDGSFVPGRLLFEGEEAPLSVLASGRLARRLYEHAEGQQMYFAALDALLDTTWDENGLLAQLEEEALLIEPYLRSVELNEHAAALQVTRDFIQGLRDGIGFERSGGPLAWTWPLRDEPCLPNVGSVSASFNTTFGTFPSDDYLTTGTGTLSGTLDGNPFSIQPVGSGVGAENGGIALIIPGPEFGNSSLYVFVVMDEALFAQAGVQDIDDVNVQASLNRFTPPNNFENLGLIYDGTVTLDASSLVVGQPVAGSVQGLLTRF